MIENAQRGYKNAAAGITLLFARVKRNGMPEKAKQESEQLIPSRAA
jgi:hypothetical protein